MHMRSDDREHGSSGRECAAALGARVIIYDVLCGWLIALGSALLLPLVLVITLAIANRFIK